MNQLNLPFAASAGLLVLWGTGKFDSDVTFLTVVFIAAYALGCSLAAQDTPISMSPVDHFPSVLAADPRTLGYFLGAAFCFGCGAVGTTVFAFSPFAGTLLYAAVVSSLFRDVSVVGDARFVAWGCVFLAGALSEHIFRLNVAAGIFALVCIDRHVLFEGHGAIEAAAMLGGLLFLALHDFTVRLILEPFRLMFRAGFLAVTAYVMVDSAMELATLPAVKPGAKSAAFVSLQWSDCFQVASDGTPLTWDRFPARLAVAAPALSCLFTTACLVRMLYANRKAMDWIKWQQLIGVALGTGLGLQLWAKYGGLQSFDAFSPLSICWISTALLLCAPQLFSSMSTVVPLNASSLSTTGEPIVSDGLTSSTSVWHATYWRGGRGDKSKATKSITKSPAGSSAKTPYPTLLLGSFSATYPELYDIATQLEDAHFALESALAKSKRYSGSKKNSFEKAKQAFACNSLVNSLVKLTEDLSTKLQERIALVERQGSVFALIDGNDPSSSSMSQKAKQRVMHLNQDLTAIHSYLDQLKVELGNRDEDTLKLLEQTFSEAKDKISTAAAGKNHDAEHLIELSNKKELDELDQMCEAVHKRIKHRKKKETEQHLHRLESSGGGIPVAQLDSSFNVALPVLTPGGSNLLYPASPDQVREVGSSESPSKAASASYKSRRGLSGFFFRSKKSTGATASSSPLRETSELNDRQSVSSSGKSPSSSRKWGLFASRSSKTKPAAT